MQCLEEGIWLVSRIIDVFVEILRETLQYKTK